MHIVLATKNRGKLKEFNELFSGEEIISFSEILGDIDIVEDGSSFRENALIKAREIYKRLGEDYLVVSDDSGISVPILNGEPNIYSARYAGVNATDRENLLKLVDKLKEKNITRTKAYYTASIAIVSRYGEYSVHGWMYGDVITTMRGDGGFGYDPIFIPIGYNQTLGELDSSIKREISHRSKALKLARPIIDMLQKKSI